MFSTEDPAWPAYKAAHDRLGSASSELVRAQAENCPRMRHAEQEFREALEAYAAARQRLNTSPAGLCNGVRSLQAWLGPPLMVGGTRQEENSGQEAG